VLLKVHEVPEKLLIVVKGQLTVYSHTLSPKEVAGPTNPALVMTVYPGSRVQTQIMKGIEFGHSILQKNFNAENVEFVGIECDLLDIKSPFSYIASETVYAYEVPYEQFFKSMLDLNPRGIAQLKAKAAQKIKWLTSLCREKEARQAACEKTLEAVLGDVKREAKLDTQVVKQFPMADKNVAFTLKRTIRLNQ
jgi:hypothetical protein